MSTCCPAQWWCDGAGAVFSWPVGPKPAHGVRGPYPTEALAERQCGTGSGEGTLVGGPGVGICAGDAGVRMDETLMMTVSGACAGFNGTFTMTPQGSQTFGIPYGVGYRWEASAFATGCGIGSLSHRLWYFPDTGCWRIDHGGSCGFVAAGTGPGIVYSASPLDMRFTVTDVVGNNCVGSTFPIDVAVFR